MMKKVKIFGMLVALVLAVTAAFAMMTGCSKDSGGQNDGERQTLQFATSKIELELGQTTQLIPSYPQDYSGAEWISRNESVATVDDSGKVTAVAIGTTIIKLTVNVGEQTQSALCQITVAKKGSEAMGQIVVSDTDVTVFAGKTYTAQAYLQFGDEKITDVEWSTSAASVCTVDNGIITGVSEGTAIVGVSCNHGGVDYSADIAVTVAAKQQTIEIDLKNDYIVKDEAVRLSTFLVKDGKVTKVDNIKVTYSVDNEDVATISGGVLTGIEAGKIELTATAETESGILSVTAKLDVLRYCNVEYMVEGEVFATERVLNSKCAKVNAETPFLDGYVFKEWTYGGEVFTADSIVDDDIEVDASWCKLTSGSGEYVKETILQKYVDGTGFTHDGSNGACKANGSFEVQMQKEGKYDYSVTIPAFNFVRQGVTQFNIDVNYSGWTVSLGSTQLAVTSTSTANHDVFDFVAYATADGGVKLVNGDNVILLTAAQANGNEGITFTTTRPQGSTYAQFTISPMFLTVYDYRAMLNDKAAVLAGMTAKNDKNEYFGYYVNYFDSLSNATPYERKNIAIPGGIAHAKELLHGGKYTLIDFTSDGHGVSAKRDDGASPFAILSGKNQLTIDPSGNSGLYTVYLPKVNYLLYKSVSFTYSVSDNESGIGFAGNNLISDGKTGKLSGTITVTVTNGVATAVLKDNTYGTCTFELSNDVANGTDRLQLFFDAALYRQLTISNFAAEM